MHQIERRVDSAMKNIEQVLAQLEQAADPEQAVKALVLAEGGTWVDPDGTPGIVEIQLAGLRGIGPSVAAAVDDWMQQARTPHHAEHERFA
ncbi:hypothetical protein [Salinihabitans flavidus]|nr:hypothetical protein [Salinihabitans flavidus]